MKESICYYYNINVDKLDELNDKYHFKIQNQNYFFVFYNRSPSELNDIIKCIIDLRNKGLDIHIPILNIENSYLTKINGNNYILFQINNPKEEFNIFDIIDNNRKLILNDNYSNIYRNNWEKLWEDKIDYYEYQIRELGLDKDIIKNSFSYYIGLAENAISYVHIINNTYSNYIPKIVWSHRRVFYPNYKINYYNPLSFIFDIEIRDIAEYLKSTFFSVGYDKTIEELQSYLKVQRLDNYMYNMLFARLLFPTYYFDIYEDVMNKSRNEDDLIKIIEKVEEYEKFLKKTYFEISKYAQLQKINWLI